jgi:hypothetical protein
MNTPEAPEKEEKENPKSGPQGRCQDFGLQTTKKNPKSDPQRGCQDFGSKNPKSGDFGLQTTKKNPKSGLQGGCQDFGLQTKNRKRGGQPGNHNAHTHGIYSKYILLRDKNVIEGMTDGSLKDELALARARLKNALERMEAAKDEMIMVAWDNACHYWFDSIVKIKATATEKSLQADEVWDTLMEAVRAANDRQGVK